MIEIDRYRPADRAMLDGLYRSVLGDEKADALARRWDWLYLENPNVLDGAPLIWLARKGEAIVGQYATMPVRLRVNGTEIDAAWGTDVMVAPDGQRQGLGNRLFDTWDRNVGAAIGLGLTDASAALFKKMQWPDLGRVSRFAKPLSATAPDIDGNVPGSLLAAKRAVRRAVARVRPLGGDVRLVAEIDESFTRLWDRVAPRFDFVVRRDAAYLDWKYVRVPHLRYSIAALVREGETAGYVVYRHTVEPRGRVTILVDFLADPDDPSAMTTLLRWVERAAIDARSDLIRAFGTFAGFHPRFREAGYLPGNPAMRFVAKINAVDVPPTFYDSSKTWHVTLGDSDADR